MNKVPTYKTARSGAFLAGASGLIFYSFTPVYAQAVLPATPVVSQGSVTIQQTTPNLTTISQSTQKAVINWNSFSIGSGNTVQFNQPGASAIAVNRVTGSSLSQIDGNLLANGQVWILNPNGVLIGAGGQINTAGFLGTTAGLSDTDFMAGNYRFNDLSARGALLQNKGAIVSAPGGYAVLAGRQVSNEGVIQANLGSVVLGGARSYALDVTGDKLLSFAVTSPLEVATANGKAVIENTGTLQADGGRVHLTARTAKDVIGGVINTTGIVQANNVALINGTVVLDAGDTGSVNIAGTISANHSQGVGGTISVNGGSIVNSGTLSVNGQDGGRVDIFAQNSIQQTGNIEANAIANGLGNGGAVALIANLANAASTTVFSGSISAKAGDSGGNGGFVETSASKLKILDSAQVDTRAAKGQTGKWLLDPTDITIGSGPDDQSVNGSPISSSISAATIQRILSNSSVVIATSSAGSQPGNITVNEAITWGQNELALKAHNNILINANLNATNIGKLHYSYGLASTDGAGSTVKVADGVSVSIPNANNFSWKKGSNGRVNNLILGNQFIRFGDGVVASIDDAGNLKNPQYFDASNNGCSGLSSWCILTFNALPYSYALGIGGAGAGTWNMNGFILANGHFYTANQTGTTFAVPVGSATEVSSATGMTFVSSPTSITTSLDISKYLEGTGSITVNSSVTAASVGLTGTDFKLSQTYTLGAQSAFVKTESKITAGSSALDNVRFWMVNPDDFFGSVDDSIKTKGNFTNTGFTQVTSASASANALLVSDSPSTATVIMYSNSTGIVPFSAPISGSLGSVFDMVGFNAPTSELIKHSPLDGYGLFVARNSVAANSSTSVVTFFGAAPNADAATLTSQLVASGDISATKPTIPTADLNNLLATIKPPTQTVLPPPPPPPPPTPVSTVQEPVNVAKPPPASIDVDVDAPPPATTQNTTTQPPPPAPGSEPAQTASSSASTTPPPGTQPPPASAATASVPAPAVSPASAPPAAGVTASAPKPVPTANAPVAPTAVASTPVAPPPPSPVGDVKPPTPKDAADTGDKTLAAAAPPPLAAAAQSKRSSSSSNSVKIGPVSVQTIAQSSVPAAAGELRFSLGGNSAAW